MPIANPEAPFEHAPGAPGIPPTWTSSAKDMVGTSLGPARLWFTTGFGIVNEIYWPRVDIPQIRDLGFIVAGPGGFWSEVKRNQNYAMRLLAPGPPFPGASWRLTSVSTTRRIRSSRSRGRT